jgi:hypothetical protein
LSQLVVSGYVRANPGSVSPILQTDAGQMAPPLELVPRSFSFCKPSPQMGQGSLKSNRTGCACAEPRTWADVCAGATHRRRDERPRATGASEWTATASLGHPDLNLQTSNSIRFGQTDETILGYELNCSGRIAQPSHIKSLRSRGRGHRKVEVYNSAGGVASQPRQSLNKAPEREYVNS